MSLPGGRILLTNERLSDVDDNNDTISYDGDRSTNYSFSSTSSTEILDVDRGFTWDIINDCESTISYYSGEDDIEENPRKRKHSDDDDEKAIKRRCPNNKAWVDDDEDILDNNKDWDIYMDDIPNELLDKPNMNNWEANANVPFIFGKRND